MASQQKLGRLMWGSIILLLTQIMMVVSLAYLIDTVVMQTSLAVAVAFRTAIVMLVSAVLLICSCVALCNTSLLWQIPLRCFSLATLIVGGRVLLTIVLHDRHSLLSDVAIRGAISLIIGIMAYKLALVLQAKIPRKRLKNKNKQSEKQNS